MDVRDDSAILIVEESETSPSLQSSQSAHVTINANRVTAADELQFHHFTPTHVPSSVTHHPTVQTHKTSVYSSFEDDGDAEDDILLNDKTRQPSVHAFWQLEYFARFFDVTTRQVLSRILWSLMPITGYGSKGNYIERHIQPNPDIYGPFWICATLVFSIAICGNITNYITALGTSETSNEWHYDYAKVGLAASTIFTYVSLVPVTLWFFFWFRGCLNTYTLFETICAYGYSLSVYIPISILWVINIRIVQLILVLIGAVLSGSVLVISFAPVVHSDPAKTVKTSYVILILIILMHALLAFAFLEYFF